MSKGTHSRVVPPRDLTPFAKAALGDVRYVGEGPKGVHVYVIVQPMGRVRAYQSAGLAPAAARGSPQEQLLVGHVHSDDAGKVLRIEGFNGREGEKFTEAARKSFEGAGLTTPETTIEPTKPLKACAYTGFR